MIEERLNCRQTAFRFSTNLYFLLLSEKVLILVQKRDQSQQKSKRNKKSLKNSLRSSRWILFSLPNKKIMKITIVIKSQALPKLSFRKWTKRSLSE